MCHCYLQERWLQNTKLFSETWLNIMISANIVSSFKTCEVYPFHPKAVFDHDPCVSRSQNLESSDGDLPQKLYSNFTNASLCFTVLPWWWLWVQRVFWHIQEVRNVAEWVQCGCSQWINEDWIGNTVLGPKMVLKQCDLIVLCKMLELFCSTILVFCKTWILL